jgi:DNA polymerase-1
VLPRKKATGLHLIGWQQVVMERAAHPAVHLKVPLIVKAGQGASWAAAH